jgi:hypothetical protein
VHLLGEGALAPGLVRAELSVRAEGQLAHVARFRGELIELHPLACVVL